MKTFRKSKCLAVVLSIGLVLSPIHAFSEDIDIFIGSSGGGGSNVLIVLDNTSNWARQANDWGAGETQGQAEVNAISSVIGNLNPSVNVGLMMWTTAGAGGGYLRFGMKPMTTGTTGNIAALQTKLKAIHDNFASPDNKGPSNAQYEGLMLDAWKYFGGYANSDGTSTPQNATHFGPDVYLPDVGVKTCTTGIADFDAYTDNACTRFNPALSTSSSCGKNYVIFIGNNGPSRPNVDTPSLITGVGGTSSGIKRPDVTWATVYQNIGYSNTCSTSGSPSVAPWTVAGNCAVGSLFADTTQWDPAASCTSPQKKWMIQCAFPGEAVIPNSSTTENDGRLADNWAKFMYQGDASAAPTQQGITTYTIDVYNDAANKVSPETSSMLMSMANVSAGNYYVAKDLQQIQIALADIFSKILASNSVFASASLPISATNRQVSDNAVFIGQFRPDPDAQPRWMGNMKKYQLINGTNGVELGDSGDPGQPAVDSTTGFISACATSFWTTDSGTWWDSVPETPIPKGTCLPPKTTFDPFSDAPDGPFVEKGAVAEVVRKGNNPSATNTTPTWLVNRTVNTLNSAASAFATFSTSTAPSLTSTEVDWVTGHDTDGERTGSTVTQTRPSLHGDVVHSRPLVVDQGGPTGITAYYGANDGTFRAVNANTGKELWAFIAPEQVGKLARLKSNSPHISYPNTPVGTTPTPTPKDYFFDGGSGLYQSLDNSTVWIYPSQRRGGRMIYGFNASSPSSPTFKWRAGCPNAAPDDTGCLDGAGGSAAELARIGQTWSTPQVAFIKGFSTTVPVVIFGGGYDACEDTDSTTVSCGSTKGNKIFLLRADTGALLQSFTTERAVAADVSLVDIDYDGYVDYLYAADMGGNLYRIDFIDGPSTKVGLAAGSWVGHTVAYTNGTARKFLQAPAVLPISGKVYVALGSGDRERPLVTNYPYTAPVQNRFYVYVDDLSASPSLAITQGARAADTLIFNLDSTTTGTNFTSPTSCSTTGIQPVSTLKSWFIDLNASSASCPARGEQTVTSAVILGGVVAFSTNRACPTATDACAKPLGEARGYLVNLLNASGAIIAGSATCGGSRSSEFVGGGLPPSPVISTVDVNGVQQTVCIGCASKDPSKPSVAIQAQPFPPSVNLKRHPVYWFTSGDH